MVKSHVRFVWLLVAMGFAASANAAIYGTSASTISGIETYTQVGGGDVIVFLTSNSLSASCPYGFWIRGSDAGAKGTLAQVLSAQAAGIPVTIWADTSVTWSGSASPSCLVWGVRGQ